MKKKFRFIVEVEDTPYNRRTYRQMGDNFMPELNENIFALETLSSALQRAKNESIRDILDFYDEKSKKRLSASEKAYLRHLVSTKERFNTLKIVL